MNGFRASKQLLEIITSKFVVFFHGYIFYRGRTGAVVSIADYGPRGPWFETWSGRRSSWP